MCWPTDRGKSRENLRDESPDELCDAGVGGSVPAPALTNQCLFSRAPIELWMLWFTHLPPLMNDSLQPEKIILRSLDHSIYSRNYEWLRFKRSTRNFFSLLSDMSQLSYFVHSLYFMQLRNSDNYPVYFLPSEPIVVQSQETKKAETLGFISLSTALLKKKFSEKYLRFMTWWNSSLGTFVVTASSAGDNPTQLCQCIRVSDVSWIV